MNQPVRLIAIAKRYEEFARTGYCVRLVAARDEKQEPPFGAIIVNRIQGRPVRSADDFLLCAESLLALHSSCEGIRTGSEAIHASIHTAQKLCASADIESVSKKRLQKIWEDARTVHLVGVYPLMCDAHPGNFFITQEGVNEKAIVVDLERVALGTPALDLAHLTLFSSGLWSNAEAPGLRPTEISQVYAHYIRLNREANTPVNEQHLSRNECLCARKLILGRTLAWMVQLVTSKYKEHIPPESLAKAYNILRAEQLERGLEAEKQFAQIYRIDTH